MSFLPWYVWVLIILIVFALGIFSTVKQKQDTAHKHAKISNEFSFLAAYGFETSPTGKNLTRFTSKTCEIRVYSISNTLLIVTLRPLGTPENPSIDRRELDLELILNCLDIPTGNTPLLVVHDNNITLTLQQAADLLKKHCQPFLQGDFTNWATIQDCAATRAKIGQT